MREYKHPEFEKVVIRAFALAGVATLTAIVVCLVRIGQTLLYY